MPEYLAKIHRRHSALRSRDFFDIFALIEHFKIDLRTAANVDLLRCVFHAKRVPLGLLDQFPQVRALHAVDFFNVRSTIKPGVKLKSFDFYFDYVCRVVEKLKPFGME